MNISSHIRDIPDFPKPGIVFKDITPLLADPEAFKAAIDELAKPYEQNPPDRIVGIDARGFLLASALAYKLGSGLAIVRKKGKLPHTTLERSYDLEYGSETLEIHEDAIQTAHTVAIVDDVLATGGTLAATIDLVEQLKGNIVGISLLMELDFLEGRTRLGQHAEKLNVLHHVAPEKV